MGQQGEILLGHGRAAVHAGQVHHHSQWTGEHLDSRLGGKSRNPENQPGAIAIGFEGRGKQGGLLGGGLQGGRSLEGPRVDPRQDDAPCDQQGTQASIHRLASSRLNVFVMVRKIERLVVFTSHWWKLTDFSVMAVISPSLKR